MNNAAPPPDEEHLRALREAWQAGLESGDAGEIDFDDLKQKARARIVEADAEVVSPLPELEALAALPEDQINTRDIPEQRDWSGARRGALYRPVAPSCTDD